MPSSNWRLIRPGEEDGGQASAPQMPSTITSPTTVAANGRDVFRGRTRATSRSTGSTGPQAAVAAGPIAGPLDSPVVAEEIRLAEQAAQERGYQIGIARAESELRASIEACGELLERIQAATPDRTSDIAHAVAELALSVAQRVVQHEVRLDPTLLCGALEAAVSTINGSPEAHVLLNPAAVEPVAQAWEALHGRAYLGKKWTFEGDPTLPVGGCTLRYEHGFVEAGLESQLEEIGIALDRAIPNLARGSAEEDVA
jgi:flagellar biosynthesis/type III secretory pathway protein FliH